MDKVAANVRAICAGKQILPWLLMKHVNAFPETEPHTLAKAFKKYANARELGMDDAFRREFRRERLNWVTADPEFEKADERPASTFKGLDLANILAIPDFFLSSPAGLEIFLRAAKSRNPRLAISSDPGPAIMSYGRALAMFGQPESHTESMPRTEREYRKRDTLNPLTVAILSEKEQWALFTKDKCLPYTEMLVSEYVKHVKAKTPDSSNKKGSSTRGWLDVEGHD